MTVNRETQHAEQLGLFVADVVIQGGPARMEGIAAVHTADIGPGIAKSGFGGMKQYAGDEAAAADNDIFPEVRRIGLRWGGSRTGKAQVRTRRGVLLQAGRRSSGANGGILSCRVPEEGAKIFVGRDWKQTKENRIAKPDLALNLGLLFKPMKFSDGAWLVQPGVQAHHPAEAHDVTRAGDELVVHAPTRPIRHRGDTLQGPLLTIRLSSPMADVIRVRIEHFSGAADHGPHIPLEPLTPPKVAITIDAEEGVLLSGGLAARVKRKEGWQISFTAGDRVLTRSGFRGMGYIQWAGKGNFMHEQLTLGVGECVYGLGERFTAFVKNGQVVENTNKDGGTGSDQAYKAVPFYLTNRGYGVLVNETGPVSFEVASEKVSRVQFSLPGEHLEYFIINGPAPKDVLRRLTALTGRPSLPPAWSFGLWLSTSFTTNYDEKTVMSFIDGMKERDLPLRVFHFDCFWMREFDWCSFEWDARVFPDPAGLLQRLKARGLKICVWINPYIAQRSALFEEGRKRRIFSEESQRRCLADRSLAARHGDCGFHQSRWAGVVRRPFASPTGDGSGLPEDRFRRTHSNRCRLS